MRITAGLRYTRDEKDQYLEIERNSNFATEIPSLAVNGLATLMPYNNAEETFTKTTPTVTVDFAWTDALSSYAKLSTGFRSGGFNVRAATPEEFQTAFEPEEMLSYELGMKSDWFDRRVRLNAAIYYNDYDDLQVVNSEYSDELRLMGGTITNAGKAAYYGGEIELSAVLTENLVFNAGYGYTKIDYKEYNKTDTVTGVTEDIAEYLDNGTVPENTFNVSLDYTIADFDFGSLRAFADASWQDNMEMDNDTRKQATSLNQDAYWVVNGRIVLSDVPMPEGDLRFALWGKNLADEEYIVHSIDYGSLGYQGAVFGDPRSYGLDVTYTY
jgi:iron complex outermembrane receptor protein